MTVFIRVAEADVDEKEMALLWRVARTNETGVAVDGVFVRDSNLFLAIPGTPFAYWVTTSGLEAFSRFSPLGESNTVLVGLQTSDDARFLRLWWEPSPARMAVRWFGFAKGGAYSPFYYDIELVLGYSEADQVGIQSIGRYGRGATHYFRPGLTWPPRTVSGLGVRAMPAQCIFGHKGPATFSDNDSSEQLLALLSIMTSSTFVYLVQLQMTAGSYEVGVIQRTPVPSLTDQTTQELARLARRAWLLKRRLDTTNETSHAFSLPLKLSNVVTGLDPDLIDQELLAIQNEIDEVAFRLYGFNSQDRSASEAQFGERTRTDREGAGDRSDDDDHDPSEQGAPVADASDAVISWVVGIAFCRFDPRLATLERTLPPDPGPFDPLPSRSPAMYSENAEPVRSPDILILDEGHADDLATHAQRIAERVKVDTPENLRGWLAKEFFPLHIKMYTKSRRKAPIYWQLATPSASYSVWLYIHNFSKDSLFRVQNDYAAPKLAHEERRLESLANELHDGATAAQRKQLAAQEAVVEELRAFLAEVKRVAPLWNPNLDDGVIINFAPLWRLVPQNKSWQKELKTTWDALCEGKYDWAHSRCTCGLSAWSRNVPRIAASPSRTGSKTCSGLKARKASGPPARRRRSAWTSW